MFKKHVTNETDVSINVWKSTNPYVLPFLPALPSYSHDYSPVGTNINLKAVFLLLYLGSSPPILTKPNWIPSLLNRYSYSYKIVSYDNHWQLRLPAYRKRDLYKQSSASIPSTIWFPFSFTANIYLLTTPDQGFLPLHSADWAPNLISARYRLELPHCMEVRKDAVYSTALIFF